PRAEFSVVRKFVLVIALDVRRRLTLRGDECEVLPVDRVAQEREGEPTEVRTPAEARDDGVRVLTEDLELPLRLQADDRLMEEDVAEDGPEAVYRLLVSAGVLEPLGHRDPEGPRVLRILLQEGAADLRRVARGCVDLRAEHTHEGPPFRLPVVDRPDPVDRRLQSDEARGVREGRAPLPRPGLCRETLVPLPLRVPRLGE